MTPILRDELRIAHGARLAELNRAVLLGIPPEAAAFRFLHEHGLDPTPSTPLRHGPAIVVGSANFAESVAVAELYAHALGGAGFPIERRLGLGNRATYFPLIRGGVIGLVPEYVGSLLAYLDESRGGISDPQQAHSALVRTLRGTGLVALQPAPAENKNGVVVTGATAARYALARVSDLGRAISALDERI